MDFGKLRFSNRLFAHHQIVTQSSTEVEEEEEEEGWCFGELEFINLSHLIIVPGLLQTTFSFFLKISQSVSSCLFNHHHISISKFPAFQTPCSTPPGSEASSNNTSRKQSAIDMNTLDELLIHNKLYERYLLFSHSILLSTKSE